MSKQNSLGLSLERFAKKFGFKATFDNNHEVAEVNLDCGKRDVKATYVFDRSEDKYQFGAVVRGVRTSERSQLSSRIMSSKPIDGLTERIVNRKPAVFGSREGLLDSSDELREVFFRQDVANIGKAVERYTERMKRR